MNAVLLQHFEANLHLGNIRPYAEAAVPLAIDYFFGPWRDAYKFGRKTMNRSQCRKKLEWIHPYREGLLCALLLDDQEAILRLAEWPDVDVNREDLDYSPGDIDYQILLARHLRGLTYSQSEKLISDIESGSKRRPKLLLAALKSLAVDDMGRFAAALTKYLDYYQRSEAEHDELERSVSMDASILWQIARRTASLMPEIPVDRVDLLLTQESTHLI